MTSPARSRGRSNGYADYGNRRALQAEIALYEKTLPYVVEDTHYAELTAGLALAYARDRQYDKARFLISDHLTKMEAKYGQCSKVVADLTQAYADVESLADNPDSAKSWYEQAIAIYEAVIEECQASGNTEMAEACQKQIEWCKFAKGTL